MPGSGQVEQVTVRFQADINQYVQAMQKAKEAIDKFAAGADSSTKKAMDASIKVAQSYSKMAQESGKLAVEQSKVAAAADKAAQAHDRLNNQTSRSTSSMTNMGSALRGAIGQYLSLGIAISQVANVVKEGMDFNKFMEVSTTAFGVMMKSVDQAKAKMKELFDYAVNSPLTFKDVVSASRQLMAYGFSAKELVPTINTLGVVAKATGVQLGDMAYVYGTLRSQGRAYTRDLMQFAMRGIPIYEELAKVVGKPVKELQKMTEEGKIGFKEVEEAFRNMTTGTGRFAGFFDEYMKTYEGKMSMLTDVWQQAMGKLTSATFETLKPIIDDLTVSLRTNGDSFAAWGKVIGGIVKTLYNMRDALTVIVTEAAILKLGSMFIAATTAAGGFMAAIEVIVLALGGWVVVGAVAAMAAIAGVFTLAKSEMDKYIANSKKEFNDFFNTKYKVDFRLEGMRTAGFAAGPSEAATKSSSEAAQAEIDALVKMTDLLRKYQDEWAMIQAKNLVASEKDIYAVVNLENELRITEMKEKLKGYNSILTKALEIQDLIHKDAIEKIRKEAEEKSRQTTYTIKAQDIIQRIAGQSANAAAKQRLGVSKGIPTEFVTQDMLDITSALDMLRGKFLLLTTVGKDTAFVEQEIIAATIMFGNMLDNARSKLSKWTTDDIVEELTEPMKELGKKIYAELLDDFDKIKGNNPSFWENNKASTAINFAAGKTLQGMAGLAYAGLQGTGVGDMMEGYAGREGTMGTGMNVFLTAISAAAGPMKLLVDFLIQIVSSSQPMMDVIAQITTSITYALMPVINMLADGFAWFFDSVIVPVGNMIIDIVNTVLGWLGKDKMNHLITTAQAKEMMKRTEMLNSAFAELGNSLQGIIDRIQSDIGETLSAIKDALSSNISSLQDLYEVGAITGAEYAAQSTAAYADTYSKLFDAAKAANPTMSDEEAAKIASGVTGSLESITGGKTLADLYERLTSQLSLMGSVEAIQAQIELLKAIPAGDTASYEALHSLIQTAITQLPEGAGTGLQASFDAVSLAVDTSGVYGYSKALSARIEAYARAGPRASGMSQTGFNMSLSDISAHKKTEEELAAFLASKGFATGTSNVPYDMPANIHKGEGIIPATFMDSIRKGDLSLSGGGGGGSVNVVVNVAGSVKTERDLATSIATEIYRQRRSGLLTV